MARTGVPRRDPNGTFPRANQNPSSDGEERHRLGHTGHDHEEAGGRPGDGRGEVSGGPADQLVAPGQDAEVVESLCVGEEPVSHRTLPTHHARRPTVRPYPGGRGGVRRPAWRTVSSGSATGRPGTCGSGVVPPPGGAGTARRRGGTGGAPGTGPGCGGGRADPDRGTHTNGAGSGPGLADDCLLAATGTAHHPRRAGHPAPHVRHPARPADLRRRGRRVLGGGGHVLERHGQGQGPEEEEGHRQEQRRHVRTGGTRHRQMAVVQVGGGQDHQHGDDQLGHDGGDDQVHQPLDPVGGPAPVQPAQGQGNGEHLQVEQRSPQGEDEPDDEGGEAGQRHDQCRRQAGECRAACHRRGREGEAGQVGEALPEPLVPADGQVDEEAAAAVHQGEDPGRHRQGHGRAQRHDHGGTETPPQHRGQVTLEGRRADPYEQDRAPTARRRR